MADLIYTLTIDGEFFTFTGKTGTIMDGKSISYGMSSIIELISKNTESFLTFIMDDGTSVSYNYKTIEDPVNLGNSFTSIGAFHTYILDNIVADVQPANIVYSGTIKSTDADWMMGSTTEQNRIDYTSSAFEFRDADNSLADIKGAVITADSFIIR